MRRKIIGSVLAILAAVALSACLSGAMGGTVTGLTGTGLVLHYSAWRSNYLYCDPKNLVCMFVDKYESLADESLAITENGPFSFATRFSWDGTAPTYNVTVATQPSGQICMTNSSAVGTIGQGVTNVAVTCNPMVEFQLLAGGSRSSADGPGANAGFWAPYGIAVDAAGNVLVADTGNHTIRKISTDGVVSTLAGSPGVAGSTDGNGAAASFTAPAAIAVDNAGNAYVTDNHSIRKISPEGLVTTLAGTANIAGSADGAGSAASFNSPIGIAVDNAGNIYVADRYNHTVRRISPEGAVTTLAGSAGEAGNADGSGAAARFNSPYGIAVDGAGNAYVTDIENRTIRKISPAGMVTTFAGGAPGNPGTFDGPGRMARFVVPIGIAVDGAGNVYVSDQGVSPQYVLDRTYLRKISPAGNVSTIGLSFTQGWATGLAVSAERLFISSTAENSVLWTPKP